MRTTKDFDLIMQRTYCNKASKLIEPDQETSTD